MFNPQGRTFANASSPGIVWTLPCRTSSRRRLASTAQSLSIAADWLAGQSGSLAFVAGCADLFCLEAILVLFCGFFRLNRKPCNNPQAEPSCCPRNREQRPQILQICTRISRNRPKIWKNRPRIFGFPSHIRQISPRILEISPRNREICLENCRFHPGNCEILAKNRQISVGTRRRASVMECACPLALFPKTGRRKVTVGN